MKAPDKIYLTQGFDLLSTNKDRYITPDIDKEWSIEKEWSKKNIEYIRKDALMEWAENWKQLGQSDDFMYAIETLIQHLNSM